MKKLLSFLSVMVLIALALPLSGCAGLCDGSTEPTAELRMPIWFQAKPRAVPSGYGFIQPSAPRMVAVPTYQLEAPAGACAPALAPAPAYSTPYNWAPPPVPPPAAAGAPCR